MSENDETNLGLSQIKMGSVKIRPLRVLRTIVGFAVVIQSVFFPQPDTTTFLTKLGAGFLLIDLTLFADALEKYRNK